MFCFYRDAQNTLAILAHTAYPGRRSLPGGVYPIPTMLGHFFGFWADDQRFPYSNGCANICECAGFLWLAPVTLFCLRGVTEGDAYRRRSFWLLAALGALLYIWLTVPVPQGIGRASFMDKSGVGRSLHVIGLINVSLVAICLSLNRIPGQPRSLRQSLLLAAGVVTIVYPAFLLINVSLANYLTRAQVILAAAYFTLAVVALVENRFKLLAASLILPQLAVFGLVNPIERGLAPIESSMLFRFMRNHPELLRSRWLVYSSSAWHSGFVSAVGCEVMTGVRYVPDLEALRVFDPAGAQATIINRSGHLLAEPIFDERPASFALPMATDVTWNVSPLDPRLRRIRVRYAAFLAQPPLPIAARLRALSPTPVSGFWLYELRIDARTSDQSRSVTRTICRTCLASAPRVAGLELVDSRRQPPHFAPQRGNLADERLLAFPYHRDELGGMRVQRVLHDHPGRQPGLERGPVTLARPNRGPESPGPAPRPPGARATSMA